MDLLEEYRRVLVGVLNHPEAYSSGWLNVQRTIFSKEDIFDQKHFERIALTPPAVSWLQARLLGPVSDVWVARKSCEGFGKFKVKPWGGLNIYRIVVNVWESNLDTIFDSLKQKHHFSLFAILHFKEDKESIWFHLLNRKSIPYVQYSAITPEDGLFKNGFYEWIIVPLPLLFARFLTGKGGVAYHHAESSINTSQDSYNLVKSCTEKFDRDTATIMMALTGNPLYENSVNVVEAANECRKFEKIFLHFS